MLGCKSHEHRQSILFFILPLYVEDQEDEIYINVIAEKINIKLKVCSLVTTTWVILKTKLSLCGSYDQKCDHTWRNSH